MQSPFELPLPSAAAMAHSQRVKVAILARIAARGGWIDFSEYMELCLYAPGLGYYSAGSVKLGPQGDFVTAPEISPLFAACLAHVIAPLIGELDAPVILELGGGSGRLAGQLLAALEEHGRLPERYFMLEVSAELRERQREELAKLAPASCHRVQWLDRLPEVPMDAIILANEVADALPVSRFVVDRDDIGTCGVGADNGRLIWLRRTPTTELAAAVAAVAAGVKTPWPDGYNSEISLALPSWIRSLAGTLRRGAMLLFDYGLSRREYYHPDRNSGTLRCHYRHRAHDDPFFLPGLQDITAWVDFTAIAGAAADSGLEVCGYTTQAHFLLDAGLERALQRMAGSDERSRLATAQQARMLILPGEMGEAVKVIALTRGGGLPVAGFGLRDLRHLL